jgi:inorganic triphosphatase YgiF
MRKYAREQAATLLRRLAFRVNRAARFRDPEAIHDLRVSIRRLDQCLTVFHQFFPAGATKRMRRRLAKLMEISGEVRNRDIALDLIRKSGVAGSSAFSAGWIEEKKQFQAELGRLLRKWVKRDLSRRWGVRLGLS